LFKRLDRPTFKQPYMIFLRGKNELPFWYKVLFWIWNAADGRLMQSARGPHAAYMVAILFMHMSFPRPESQQSDTWWYPERFEIATELPALEVSSEVEDPSILSRTVYHRVIALNVPWPFGRQTERYVEIVMGGGEVEAVEICGNRWALADNPFTAFAPYKTRLERLHPPEVCIQGVWVWSRLMVMDDETQVSTRVRWGMHRFFLAI